MSAIYTKMIYNRLPCSPKNNIDRNQRAFSEATVIKVEWIP